MGKLRQSNGAVNYLCAGMRIEMVNCRGCESAIAYNFVRRCAPRPTLQPVSAICGAVKIEHQRHGSLPDYATEDRLGPARMRNYHIKSFFPQKFSQTMLRST